MISDFDRQTTDFDSSIDADQVERQALRMGVSNSDFGLSDERISGSIDDSITENGNAWEERQALLEEKAGNILREIERRRTLMGDSYPFAIEGQSIRYIPSKLGVYEFCLVASAGPTKRLKGGPPASVVFEWISRDALKAYFGPKTQGFRTGWPRVKKYESRGARAKQTYQALEKACGEFHWSPKEPFPNDPSPNHLKDVGLDVVVWIPPFDSRYSKFVALAQCGCGKNDVCRAKAQQLSLERLKQWLNPLTVAAPLRCFFIAHHVPNESQLFELASDGGIIFDRARIALIAQSTEDLMISPEGINYWELAHLLLEN